MSKGDDMEEVKVELHNICKKFERKVVLKDVNMSIHAGDVIVFIGSNGTGKSTLLKMITGLIYATSGDIIRKQGIRFAYIPEKFPGLSLTAKQYLESVGEIEKLDRQYVVERCEYYFEKFQMTQMMDTPMKFLSKGTLQKVVVVQALLRIPDVLILDEPLSGQDIQSQKFFIEQIKELRRQGVAIVMSCHEEYLINQTATIVYRIQQGTLHKVDLHKEREKEWVRLIFSNTISNIKLEQYSQIKKIDILEDRIELVVSRKESNELIVELIQRGMELNVMEMI